MVADLKDAEYRDAVHALAREAAVVVEQFHPRVLDRLARGSAGYDAIATTNSAVLYCSITGYGQWGRTSAEPARNPTISRRPASCRSAATMKARHRCLRP